MKWNESDESIRKSRSPNSIYFYLKKYDNDLEKAQKDLDDYRERNKNNLKPKNKIDYWLWKGYSQEEAEIKRAEWTKQHFEKINKIPKKNPYNSEIENLMKKTGCSKEHAIVLANKRRITCSPRRKEYWIKKGYTESEAANKVTEWQSTVSPRTISYWINKGLSEKDAIKKVSEYQDNISIDAICNRLKCTREEALEVQIGYIEKTRLTCDFIEDEYYGLYLLYKRKVDKLTKQTYKLYKKEIDPYNLRSRDYHLDHKYSIKDGFINEIPAEIISSKYNLQIISASENSSKQSKSKITIEELYKKYKNENKNKHENKEN